MSEQAQNEAESQNYKAISILVDKWLEIHKNETFKHDDVCRQLECTSREARQLIAIKLNYEVSKANPKLEKLNRIYRYINNNKKVIDWVNASDADILDIHWPYDNELQKTFGFDGHVTISPGDVLVIAGVSNTGKTTFCLNFLWENMDNYHCLLMGNEYTPVKFRRRISRMTWNDPIGQDGKPKFELIERRDGWKDIVEPDAINIIDWLNLGDNFFQIGTIIEGIQSKLKKGIALIALQKDPNKERGLGGMFSEHLASLYLAMDFNRLTCVKAKEWNNGHNPNHEIYGFDIVEFGSKFHNIRPVKQCPKCKWTRDNTKCELCKGIGYIDVEAS